MGPVGSVAVEVRELQGVSTLVVVERWRAEFVDEAVARGVRGLSIRVTAEADLDVLGDLPELELLVVQAGTQIRDLSAIEELRSLWRLSLALPSRPKLPLDLTSLPLLRDLGITWNPGFESLFACTGLEVLNIANPPDVDFGRFAPLSGLKKLVVSQGRKLRSTAGIESLQYLEMLGLWGQSALERLDGVGQLSGLRELSIDTCKRISSIEEVRSLRQLRELKLANCGDIRSLAPLSEMFELEEFYAWESTRIVDGDLAVLLRLPQLRRIALQSRREYRPTVAEVEQQLSTRG